MSTEGKVLEKHYKQLIGYTITDIVVVDDEMFDSPQVAIFVKKGHQQLMLSLLSDPEGNDTGFLDISNYEEA